ncbi:hypothetical protein L1987_73164 [Smallanthus sonchifolius]|uniref:Uncharacterized protein n=1 Tax=Smallanthus sonchifolius TaxID=185202 RepID=A0ACB8ZZS4_9ASTR|nr:hypothetical protein L1987_73164 [Smallanthus sonchifolius]
MLACCLPYRQISPYSPQTWTYAPSHNHHHGSLPVHPFSSLSLSHQPSSLPCGLKNTSKNEHCGYAYSLIHMFFENDDGFSTQNSLTAIDNPATAFLHGPRASWTALDNSARGFSTRDSWTIVDNRAKGFSTRDSWTIVDNRAKGFLARDSWTAIDTRARGILYGTYGLLLPAYSSIPFHVILHGTRGLLLTTELLLSTTELEAYNTGLVVCS